MELSNLLGAMRKRLPDRCGLSLLASRKRWHGSADSEAWLRTGTIEHPVFGANMMKQTSFSDVEFVSKKKLTRCERFLSEIEATTPWPALVAALLPCYSKGDGRGRPPIGLERMRRK